MTGATDKIGVAGLSFDFNRQGGNIAGFEIETDDGTQLRPLHTAPWADDPSSLPESVDLVERQLAGDFFCAPFGGNEGLPIHGWTANGTWKEAGTTLEDDGAKTISYRLVESVQGADVEKSFTLVPGHPVLYQCHRFTGGSGVLPVAHHAMIRVPGGARLSFSPKQFGVTPNEALENDPARGHSMLAYPKRFSSLDELATADGGTADARTYPFSRGHEDIAVLAEQPGSSIGWSAALAAQDGFLFFAIKDARVLPETLLWMSNGGRNYPPWSGRHTAVLGIEEAATRCHEAGDFAGAASPSQYGLAQGLDLGAEGDQIVRYAFGAIPAPTGWTEVANIRAESSSLTLEDAEGDTVTLPFHGSHFEL